VGYKCQTKLIILSAFQSHCTPSVLSNYSHNQDKGRLHTDTSIVQVHVSGYSKHEFACIPIAAIHNNTGSVRVQLTLKYEQFLCTVPLFSPWRQQKRMPESFVVNTYVTIMAYVM